MTHIIIVTIIIIDFKGGWLIVIQMDFQNQIYRFLV